ncbi:engulfment and cell motility protein 1-like [Paramacrobiotus metropolitanus]|uniref:engulfment and cell motility protein 1-like n=1 Tax=Paramacrobiotus metropolitanus TaxID=2943436 RepID=UPI002445C652|nr:engulfment and cell motility protein 1-like [Paramacrobiotus metropolitanus]XP_055328991.1 engulfment and cell motility protein 1-like [Paramacrobiotus metropolitanus]
MDAQNGAGSGSAARAAPRPVTTVSGGSGDGRQESGQLKVGVKFYADDPSKLPQMVKLDFTRPLSALVEDLCAPWGIPNHQDFALQLQDPQNPSQMIYVTAKNRDEIKNGSVLVLSPSASEQVKSILESLRMGDATKKRAAVTQLAALAPDVTFAEEFITQDGMELLVTIIEKTGWDKSLSTVPFMMPELIGTLLGAYHDLIELHGIVSWDTVDQNVIAKVASYVNKSSFDPATVQISLTILESLLLNSSKQASVAREISLPHVMEHLKQPSLQQSILSLINAIFARGMNDAARQSLAQVILSSGTREIVLNEVIPLNQTPKPEIAKQLFILQMHLMKVINFRVMNHTWETETAEKHLQDLRKSTAAVLAEVPSYPSLTRKNSEPTEELSRLGFKHTRSPLDDLMPLPEGALVLDCMQYFAMKHPAVFRQWILESCSRSASDCPFLLASLHVVRVLLETFRVVELPSGEFPVGEYDRVVFTSEYPFEEAYVLGMQTLCRTWKEMKASAQDFMKVIGVLKEKVDLSLRDPPAPGSVEAWRERVKEYTYGKINEIREARKNAKEQLESKAEPIVQLREMLRSEVLGLITENRIRHMQEGTLFSHYERRMFAGKSKTWKCKLSINKKLLHYGDADESSSGQLAKVIGISEIKALLTGKECPHVKNKKNYHNVAFSLALIGENKAGENKTLDFIAPSEFEFNMWTDGLRVLLGEEMSSPLAASDMEELLTWEIKMRLLGTEGIAIPEKIPEMPPLPDNFNFAIAL